MAAALLSSFRSLSSQALTATDQFIKFYYDAFDTQRHNLQHLYSDMSTLVWNGNGYHGADIVKFFTNNLPKTTHEISSIDCQPVNQGAMNATSILVVCEGIVRYGDEKDKKHFNQNFLLVSENNTWKIRSDCFRFIDIE